jgi:fucose permease
LTLQLVAFAVALNASANISLIAFPICGFLTSVMYGSVFSLGMNSLKNHHGSASGIFCTGIICGAVVPLAVGLIGNTTSLHTGMCFVFVTILYLLYISITAKPFVDNKTVKFSELFSKDKTA